MPKKTRSTLDSLHADRDALQARRAEIAADRDAAAAALATAQDDLIDGKPDAAERVTTAQARVNGADGALAMIADRLASLDVQIENTERAASLEAHRAMLRTSAEAAEDARRRYFAAIDTARQALTTAARQAETVEAEWRDASTTFVSALQACVASGDEQDAVLATLKDDGIGDAAALDDRFHHKAVCPIGTTRPRTSAQAVPTPARPSPPCKTYSLARTTSRPSAPTPSNSPNPPCTL